MDERPLRTGAVSGGPEVRSELAGATNVPKGGGEYPAAE